MKAISRHLDDKALLSDQHFEFRFGGFSSDLMFLFRDCQDALNNDIDSFVVALGIVGFRDLLLARNIHDYILMQVRSNLQERTKQSRNFSVT